jgi:hypothetical protein
MTETFIDPAFRLCSGPPTTIDGITFHPYSTGVLRYAKISEDGKIKVRRTQGTAYTAEVIGVGAICGPSGSVKRFHSQLAAMKAGVALHKKLQVQSDK